MKPTSNFARNVRNYLNIKPSVYLKPESPEAPISDFIPWINVNNFETKFIITNLATYLFPSDKMEDEVLLLVYDNAGNKIVEKKYLLEFNKTFEVNFSDFNINGFGSFFIFHKLKSFAKLIEKSSHIADRGYVGFRRNKGLWSFVHGNNYAASLEKNNKIKSLMGKKIFNSTFIPQVSFDDVKEFQIIVSNPTEKDLNLTHKCYNNDKELILNTNDIIKPFGTIKTLFDNPEIETVTLTSKLLFCRPVIYKEYKTYFDIFHS